MGKRKVYILLTKFSDKGSKVLTALTGCYYPHASIGLEEDKDTFYSFVTKGFIVESLTRYVKPDREPYLCSLYELEVSDNVYSNIKNIIGYFVEFKRIVRYDRLGVLMALFHIPYKRNRFKYFCSNFVAEVLHRSGAVKLNKKSHSYFSKDIVNIPGMRLMFAGNMRTMIKRFG